MEFLKSGYMATTVTVDYFPANFELTSLHFFSIFCVVLLAVIMFFMFWNAMSDTLKKRRSSLRRFWLAHTLVTCILSAAGILFYIIAMVKLENFKKFIKDGDVIDGASVDEVVMLNNSARYVFGTLAFLVIVRVSILF